MPSLKLSNPFRRGDGRPSLKERAAALKASAARVLKRPERAAASSSNARAVYVDPIGEDGLMTYLDAAGNQHRQPVGHWIAFMSQRMYSIARRDYDRRFRDRPSERLEGDGWIGLDAQLRRELSLDALKLLAFKPLSVFDAVQAESAPVDSEERHPDAALIALCNEAAREERTAQIKCNTDPDPGPGEEEPDYWGRSGDLLAQAKAAKPVSLPGLAAKAKVVLAHAPEAIELGAQPLVYELALALVRDAVRIGTVQGTRAASLPASDHAATSQDDPVHALIAEHRAILDAFDALPDPECEKRSAEFWTKRKGVEDRMRTIAPTTGAGLRALVAYLRENAERMGEDISDDKTEMGFLLHVLLNAAGTFSAPGVPAAATASASDRPEVQTAVDPIHAAIAASREAQAAYETWERGVRGRMTKAEFATEDRLVAEQSRTREAAFSTVPTTRAGQIALLDYTRWQLDIRGQGDGADVDVEVLPWRDAYEALEASLRAGAPAEDLAGRGA